MGTVKSPKQDTYTESYCYSGFKDCYEFLVQILGNSVENNVIISQSLFCTRCSFVLSEMLELSKKQQLLPNNH